MGLTYFKRFRMEIDLLGQQFAPPPLPAGYRLLAWDDALLEAHAEAKYHSFKGEIDSNVFPCLGDWLGCHRLMQEIRAKQGFLPEATWLVGHETDDGWEYAGTVQGIRDYSGMGAIQNLGVTPEHRSRQLGSALLLQALDGFQQAGLRRAFLEVTAQNNGAIRLYQRMGFAKARTVYKAVEVAYT
ncbi:MAG: GNAT family N-acetyltransferase [Planctomycetota bacterium]|nr:MAG: GNAT family N-acetyltransferase [Planctomycetota bacterium]